MKKVKLSVVCNILNGFAFQSDKYVSSGLRIIRIANVQKGYIEDKLPCFYPIESKEEYKKYQLYEDDLLISLTGNVGRVALMDKKFLPALLNQRVACLRIKDVTKVDKHYLFSVLNSDLFEDSCIRSAKGVAQKNISTDWLKEFEITLPSLEEQKAIANKLDKVTALINKRKEQLAKLDQLVKSRFIEMFGEPESNPMHWEMLPLENCLTVLGGYAFKSEEFKASGIPVLRIGNINTGVFTPTNMVYWAKDVSLERYQVLPGDLVISLTGTVGKDDYGNVCILGNAYPLYYLNQRNAKLNLGESLNKHYLSELLKFSQIKKKLTGISRGVRQANISNRDILNLVVPIPPIELQDQYAAFVEQTDKSKLAIQQSLEQLETLKKSLMQKYFG